MCFFINKKIYYVVLVHVYLRWGKYKCLLDLSLNEVEWNDMFKDIAITDILEANSFSEKIKYMHAEKVRNPIIRCLLQ